jgi:hypothetical protein
MHLKVDTQPTSAFGAHIGRVADFPMFELIRDRHIDRAPFLRTTDRD